MAERTIRKRGMEDVAAPRCPLCSAHHRYNRRTREGLRKSEAEIAAGTLKPQTLAEVFAEWNAL